MAWLTRYTVILTCMVWCVEPGPPLTMGPHERDPDDGSPSRAPRSDTGYGSVVRVRRKAADSTQLWPDAVVPFTFLAPEPERAIVWKGLAHWQQHTCLRFHPVNDTDLPHLQFRRLAGCRSGVGIEGTSGQNISIGDNCNKMGIVVHEIGHAVGFYHEIRRPDRDQHVVVNERNILKDELFNFYKLHWLDVSIKYDLSSVMHYHTLEWSANERTTVATRDPTLQGLIGMWKRESSQGLSHRDKLLANKMYGCLDQWLAKCNLNRNPCENEGYLGKNCTCVCPSGTRGRTCQEITGGYYDHLKSPCSLDVTYPTIISTPHYPSNYDADTWCVYRLQAPECHAPEVTVYDFQLGPRDMRDQCFHDYLEVRNDSLYDGFLKCGTDVVRGTRWVASSSVMILFFKGAEGGYRGFRAQVRFTPIPGCCETHSNSSSAVYLHTPGYPKPYTQDFHCTYGLAPEEPARVVVTVSRKDGSVAADPWTCALRLCQPNGRCYRHCRKLRQRWLGSRGLEVVLPNVASLHHLQYTAGKSPFTAEKAAYQVSFTLEDSPCHKTMIVNRSDPRGWITVGPRFFEILQCEWWFQAPRGSHVKVSVEDLYLPGHEDTYLAVNEAGEPTYPAATTRVYYRQEDTPHSFVSLEHKVSLVLQGDFITQMTMKYELYECTDEDQECEYWAVNDECEKNPLWMKPHCRRSCLRCDYSTTCENRHQDCEFWAKHDQCQENRFWMHVHCRKACGLCELCVDANTWCPRWAALGDCEGNPDYMEHFCRKSCGLCDCGASTNHNESPAKNVTTTSTTVGRPTSTTTATPVVSDPPPHPRRNRTNKIRKKKKKKTVTSTTTPTIKSTRTTNSWEKETTRGISINQTFKPQKRKGKNTSNKIHLSKNNFKERGHTYDDVKQLDKKETARYPSKPLSPQTPTPLDKKRTPRVLEPNRHLKPYDKNGTFDKRVSRKKKIQTAFTPTPRRTTKLTVKKKFRGAGVVTAAPRRVITAVPQRRGNVSQSSRKGERVTPAHPKADNKTLTSPPVDTVAPSSTKMENVSKASLKPERLIQTSLKANGRSSVHPTADRVTPTSPLPQVVNNMSSESSIRSTKNSSVAEDNGSTTLEDPRVIYKSQEIYGEEDPTAGQMKHVSETCEQSGEHGCGRGRNDVGIPTYGNEVFLNSLVRSRHYESTTRSAAGSTVAPSQVDDAAGAAKKRKQRRHGRNKNKVRNQRRRNKNKRRKHRRRNRKNKLTTRRGHQRTRTQHPGGGRHRDSKHTENRRISRGGGGGRKKQWRGGARRKENRGRSDGKGGRGDDQTPDTTRSHLPRRRQDRSRKSEMPVDGGRPKTTSPPVPRVTESRSTLHPLLTTHVIPTLSLTPIQSSIIPQSTHSPFIIQTSTTQLSTKPPPITQALGTVRSIHSLHIIQVPTTQLPSTQHPSIIQLTPTTQPPYLSTTSASPSLPLRPYATLPVPQHSISNWTPEELPPALVRTTTTASTRLAMPHRQSSPTATPTMTTMASLLTAEPPDDTLTAQCPHCPRTTETGRVAEELSPAGEAAASTSTRQRQVEQPAPQTLHQNNVYRHHPLSTNSADPPRKQGKSRKNELTRRRQRLLKEQQLYRRHQMKRLLSRQKHRHNKHQFDWKESGQRNKGIYNTSTVRHRPYSHRFTGRLHPDVSPRLSITSQKIPFHPHPGHYRRTPYSQRLTLDDRAVESSSAFPYTLNRPPIRSQQSRLISDMRAEPTGLRLDVRNKPHSETHATNRMQPGKERGQQQAPQPSPERYAEWGIGPVKHPHQPSRRTRPGWKFRRAFYRREYIYEDIRPPRPLRDRGFSRMYT